jgi:Polyketide cyclase / dehydrase and lipid transport
MPPVDLRFDVPPERVFEVLSQPPTYSYWVVGARSVESFDAAWPAPGTRFRHTQGKWPLIIRDHTESVRSDPPHRLEIVAKARPLLVAKVVFEIKPEPGGCRVWMDELGIGGLMGPLTRIPPNPQLTKWRNNESLRRLRELAEGRRTV